MENTEFNNLVDNLNVSDNLKNINLEIRSTKRKEIDCSYTDEVVCPHCGYNFFEYTQYKAV